MNLLYRNMTIDDFAFITNLWSKSGAIGYSESDSYERLKDYFLRNPDMSFVACDDYEIVGTVLCGHDGRRGFINHLYVKDEFREKGIATHLVALASERLAEENLTKSYLFVKVDNDSAKMFWKKRGFYEVDDIAVMRKSLSKVSFQTYEEFNVDSVVTYMKNHGYFLPTENVTGREFGDGNMNMIFRVLSETKSYIVKQSMPHGKINVKEYEPLERAKFEAMSLKIQMNYVEDFIPKHYFFDAIMNANVYEDLSRMITLRKALKQGILNQNLGKNTGKYLARMFYFTSNYGMDPQVKKKLSFQFTNFRLREITENYMFTDPFFDADSNRIGEKLRPRIEALWENKKVLSHVQILKNKFINCAECLISGDFHPGNVFVSDHEVKFFDFEFAFWGPIAYDLGTMVGNLVINIMTQSYYHEHDSKRYVDYLINIIKDIRNSFTANLLELFEENQIATECCEDLLSEIERDLIGFAGCNMIGRTYGYCQFSEITEIADPVVKVEIQESIIDLAEKLIGAELDFDRFLLALSQ